MIISRNLLSHYFPGILDFHVDGDIIPALFRAGIEVEGIFQIPTPTHLYYGQVRSVSPIEGSDRLRMCEVWVPESGGSHDIVCGAENVRQGLRVLVALPGAVLLNGTLEIKPRKIMGVQSNGMICAYSELYESGLTGIGLDVNGGIIELGDGWDIDAPFDPLELNLDDVIFDITIPANRPDLNCAWGLAMELNSLLRVNNCVNDLGKNYLGVINTWPLKGLLIANGIRSGDSHDELLTNYLRLSFGDDEVRSRIPYLGLLVDNYLKRADTGLSPGDLNIIRDPIVVDWDGLINFLGINPGDCEALKSNLINFGFEIGGDEVRVPPWRVDIKGTRDLISRAIAHMGIDVIRSVPVGGLCGLPDNSHLLTLGRIRNLLCDRHFFECSTFNLQEGEDYENVESKFFQDSLGRDQLFKAGLKTYYRRNALFGLLGVMKGNLNRRNAPRPIFEIAHINCGTPYYSLNILAPQLGNDFCLSRTRVFNDFYDLKNLLCRAYGLLNRKISLRSCGKPIGPLWGDNLFRIEDGGRCLGYIGYLKSELPFDTLAVVCDLCPPSGGARVAPGYSEFPCSLRDISISPGGDIGIGELMGRLGSEHLVEVKLIEHYLGKNSFLIRCKFQSPYRTLTTEDIDRDMDLIYGQIRSNQFVIR